MKTTFSKISFISGLSVAGIISGALSASALAATPEQGRRADCIFQARTLTNGTELPQCEVTVELESTEADAPSSRLAKPGKIEVFCSKGKPLMSSKVLIRTGPGATTVKPIEEPLKKKFSIKILKSDQPSAQAILKWNGRKQKGSCQWTPVSIPQG